MHTMEGFLPLERTVVGFVTSIRVIGWGFLRIGRLFSEHPTPPMSIPFVGSFKLALSSLRLLELERTYRDIMNKLAHHPGTMRMRALVPRLSGSADRMKMDTEIAHHRETALRR